MLVEFVGMIEALSEGDAVTTALDPQLRPDTQLRPRRAAAPGHRRLRVGLADSHASFAAQLAGHGLRGQCR